VLKHIFIEKEKLATIGFTNGYCYLAAFEEKYLEEAREYLGCNPSIAKFMQFYKLCLGRGMKDVEPLEHVVVNKEGNYHLDLNVKGVSEVNYACTVGAYQRTGLNEFWCFKRWQYVMFWCSVVLLGFGVMDYLFTQTFVPLRFTVKTMFFHCSLWVICIIMILYVLVSKHIWYKQYLLDHLYGTGRSSDVVQLARNIYQHLNFQGNTRIALRNMQNHYRTYFVTRAGRALNRVTFTQGKVNYDVTVPVHLQHFLNRVRDTYNLIPRGFNFVVNKNSVDTGHSLSTVNNRIVRHIINNDIGAGCRVLHVGENIATIPRESGHVCLYGDNEVNDAKRVHDTQLFINTHDDQPIEAIRGRFEDVQGKFDVVTAIHSVYDQEFDEFFRKCFEVGAKTVYIAIHFHTLLLENADAMLPFTQFYVHQDKKNDKILFKHCSTDEKLYEHSLSNYWKYIAVPTVKFEFDNEQNQAVNICYYNRRVIYNNFDVVVFRYDLSNHTMSMFQKDTLITPLCDDYVTYYKCDYVDCGYIKKLYSSNMVSISREFFRLVGAEQFQGYANKGENLHYALSNSSTESAQKYNLFYQVFKTDPEVMNVIADDQDGCEDFYLFEFTGCSSVHFNNAFCTIKVEDPMRFGLNLENNASIDLFRLDINASVHRSNHIVPLLVNGAVQDVPLDLAVNNFNSVPVACRIADRYVVNVKALHKNVKDVVYLQKIGREFVRNSYSEDESNHNIENEKDPSVIVVENYHMFELLCEWCTFGHETGEDMVLTDMAVEAQQRYGQPLFNTEMLMRYCQVHNCGVLQDSVVYTANPVLNILDQRIKFIRVGGKLLTVNFVIGNLPNNVLFNLQLHQENINSFVY